MATRLRIYVDTSVIGGCLDPEFETWSRALFRDFHRRAFDPLISDVTAAEIEEAPPPVQALFRELIAFGAEILPVTASALILVSVYTRRRILGPRFRNDMLHIAVATVAEADALVSWNFRHIVRLDKIRRFNAINLEHGYRELSIYSPREVTTYGREERS